MTGETRKSKLHAVKEEAHLSESKDVGVSGDGSQKRGHKSLNGVASVIGLKTGKIIDAEVLSKVGFSCQNIGESVYITKIGHRRGESC